MKCIEIINLRSAGERRESIEQKIPRSMSEVDQNKDLVSIQLYRHASLDTDLSVHLLFEHAGPEAGPSVLGQRLASAFKEFGLVSHSVWIESAEG